jgi:circadian clock protein KaiB
MTIEDATENTAGVRPPYKLRLIVAGSNARSRRAIRLMQRICESDLSGKVDIETIDIYQQPELAKHYEVIAAPMLVRLRPLPVRRVISDFHDAARLLQDLEITTLNLSDNRLA